MTAELMDVHILPGWNGDTNFMTSVDETRVLAGSLEGKYDQLRGVIDPT